MVDWWACKRPSYRLEPVERSNGVHYHLREGKHQLAPADWQSYLDFADQQFGRLQ